MQLNLKPRYKVRRLDGTYTKTIAYYDPETKRLSYREEERPQGFLVSFPNKSSVHIATEEELKRQGYDKPPALIDENTGDEVPINMSIDMDEAPITKRSNRSK